MQTNQDNENFNKKINLVRDLLDNRKLSLEEARIILGLDEQNAGLLFSDTEMQLAEKKNILITGGAGFIGANFIHYMLAKYPGYKLVNLDLLTYAGNLESLKSVESNPNYEFVNADICDAEKVNETIKKHNINLIVHFAAESHVDRSISGSQAFMRTNVEGTRVLLEAAKNNGNIRFHHVSTDEVFGALGMEDDKFHEKTLYDPRSPYSASKAASDHVVRAYYHTHGVPITISNCSNNYGPYQFPEKLIPLFVTNLMEGKKVPVYGTGENIRDWIHVDDHNAGVDAIIHNGRIGETYCLGGDNEVTNVDITKKILAHLGKDEDHIEHIEDRLGHDLRYAINFGKAKRELGWEPKISFEEGLEKTIKWYQENTGWWQKIKSGEYQDYYKQQYGK